MDPFKDTPLWGEVQYSRLHGITGYSYRYTDAAAAVPSFNVCLQSTQAHPLVSSDRLRPRPLSCSLRPTSNAGNTGAASVADRDVCHSRQRQFLTDPGSTMEDE